MKSVPAITRNAHFGPSIRNSDGVLVATETVARQHVEEDCRGMPNASDWLEGYDPPAWLRVPLPDAADLARMSALRFGGDPETYLPLHEWFLATRLWSDSPAHLIFRHQAFGIHETESRFGPALADGAHAVPTRVVAERHVRSVLGRLPAAPDLLRRIRAERWMLQATSPARMGLA